MALGYNKTYSFKDNTDVSHKSAKVLMNDETGRRNYTKYNKYITLMKVTDEDGDPKQMKSGEMTPNQEASLSMPRRRIESNINHSTERMSSPDDEKSSMSLNQNALLFNISNNSIQFNSCADNNDKDEDRQTENDGNTKKVSFKCKKCNFRYFFYLLILHLIIHICKV